MKLNQTVTWVKQGTFETYVKLTDDDGKVLKELTNTYEKTASFYPAYDSLCYAIKPYYNKTIEVTTSHDAFRYELGNVYESSKQLAYRLTDLLKGHNLELVVKEDDENV